MWLAVFTAALLAAAAAGAPEMEKYLDRMKCISLGIIDSTRQPTYVEEYRNSGSKYDKLLTGLALFNLGRLENMGNRCSDDTYNTGKTICVFSIQDTDHMTAIECKLISSMLCEAKTKNNPVIARDYPIAEAGDEEDLKDALEEKGPSIRVESYRECLLMKGDVEATTIRAEALLLIDCSVLEAYEQCTRREEPENKSSILYIVGVIVFSVIVVGLYCVLRLTVCK